MLLPSLLYFQIEWSFEMRYCMNFYLKWQRNYTWSKLELRYLLNKKQTSNFDHAQFLRQLRQKFIQYLILKLQSIVKKGGKGQRMFAFLCSKIALSIWYFQYIKWGLWKQKLPALQLVDSMPYFLGFHAKHFWNP